ncbi:endothelial differentiation-related factor 1 homolog [Oppia nitens]|uniref:endothelial differentiation-related factor 1 homolog n=1 Tax=Oppia nitens TaxID=1686743 RepID=UPI0023DB9B31|nr:endothelial differentiation-related factor 1 homolog [Oppia nitens]
MADWDEVTVLRKRPQKASAMKTQAAINAAQKQGIPVETSKKYGAATNKHPVTSINTAKLDRETEELHHDTIGQEVCRIIQQWRQQKGMTQKDLATKICEKPQVVNEYESGKAIPNQQVLAKLERALGVKLRGKEKGQPLVPKPAKK